MVRGRNDDRDFAGRAHAGRAGHVDGVGGRRRRGGVGRRLLAFRIGDGGQFADGPELHLRRRRKREVGDGQFGPLRQPGRADRYAYDALNDLTQITNQNATGSSGITAKCVALSYNADGSLDTITRYNGATTGSAVVATTRYRSTTGGTGSGYDALGRITAMQQVYGSSPSTTISYTWQYDPAGNVTQSCNSTDGTDTYTTDSANQLTSAEPDEREL